MLVRRNQPVPVGVLPGSAKVKD
jgi:hypothetical protein